VRLGPSKSSIPSFFVFRWSLFFPFPSLSRVFLFLFFFFSLIFPFIFFLLFLSFPSIFFQSHFFFLCNPNPRIQDAATEVKAACHDATLSLPSPRSPYSSSGSTFPSLPLIFTFSHTTYSLIFFTLILRSIYLLTPLIIARSSISC